LLHFFDYLRKQGLPRTTLSSYAILIKLPRPDHRLEKDGLAESEP